MNSLSSTSSELFRDVEEHLPLQMSVAAEALPLTSLDCFARQSRNYAKRVAVQCQDSEWTYQDIDCYSSQLARFISQRGVRHGDVVGVCMAAGMDSVAALLAVWKVGGIYLPLESSHPADRLHSILAETDCRLLMTNSNFAAVFRGRFPKLICLDSEQPMIAACSNSPRLLAARPADVAYLLYTSGSTGKPKGVMVRHDALVNKLVHAGTWGTIDNNCCAALLASTSFDASLAQILLPLAHGGKVVVVEEHDRLNPQRMWTVLAQSGVNVLDCTPSWLLAMLDAAPLTLKLQRVVLGGETLTPALARRVFDQFPGCKLINIYGPTEACIDALAHQVCMADTKASSIPIGCPLPGYRAYVLDKNLNVVPDGQPGELYIGGKGLAAGYWKNPELTLQRFLPDPFQPGERLYKSGDLVLRRAGGEIEFLGRSDQQIKLRGQRIELGEIECAIASINGVSAAVVKAWPSADELDVILVAYLVCSDTASPKQFVAHVRSQLALQLPQYMVPAFFERLDQLPLLPTGKVDRAALPYVTHQRTAHSTRQLPQSDLERQLAGLWREVLQMGEFDVTDNFFELGGHSLSAVRLLARIQQEFNVTLSIAILFSAPTVAELALVLMRSESRFNVGRTLVLSHHKPLLSWHAKYNFAEQGPLFLLPPGSGLGLVFAGLARELSAIVSTIALQAVNLKPGRFGNTSMQEMAGAFIHEIQKLQPSGAVRLCGYSAGGAIAHEMVRQLLQQGREVSHLILIDPYCAHAPQRSVGNSSLASAQPENQSSEEEFWEICRDMIADAMNLRGSAADPVLKLAQRLWQLNQIQDGWNKQSAELLELQTEAAEILPATMDFGIFLLLLEGVGNVWFAYIHHMAKALENFQGRAWMIQPDADEIGFRQIHAADWRFLIGGDLQTSVISGEHATMMGSADTVKTIGRQMRHMLTSHHAQNEQLQNSFSATGASINQ